MKAIRLYASEECERFAKKIEYRLHRMPASGVFGYAEHRNLWHEYCAEMQWGPSGLRDAFEIDIEKMIDFVVAEIPHRQAVLLTVAAMWDADELEGQDGDLRSDDHIRDEVLKALRQRAMDDYQEQYSG